LKLNCDIIEFEMNLNTRNHNQIEWFQTQNSYTNSNAKK